MDFKIDVSVKDTDLFKDIIQLMAIFRDDVRVPEVVKAEFDNKLDEIMKKYSGEDETT